MLNVDETSLDNLTQEIETVKKTLAEILTFIGEINDTLDDTIMESDLKNFKRELLDDLIYRLKTVNV